MTELERFKCVVNFEKPDYWPLLCAHALGPPHGGGYVKLHREGLPEEVNDTDSWARYWGMCTYDHVYPVGEGAPGVKSEKVQEGEFEIIRYETGAVTRQVVGNELVYCMPDFQEFHVRDRASWERYRDLITPRRKATEKLAGWRERFRDRTRPVAIHAGSTWGVVRDDMGPEAALLVIYDDPDLLREMIAFRLNLFEEFTVPVIEAVRPNVITMWEDFCYNHGMLIGPDSFREFCAPYYRRVAEVGRDCGVELMGVDCDGKVDEFCVLLEEVGLNGCWPLEQVCGNDPVEYRKKQPGFIFVGGIEKEIVNSGNASRIEPELYPKVPKMLEGRGAFPQFDHGLQPSVGFEELCRCVAELHKICGSDLGDFPRP